MSGERGEGWRAGWEWVGGWGEGVVYPRVSSKPWAGGGGGGICKNNQLPIQQDALTSRSQRVKTVSGERREGWRAGWEWVGRVGGGSSVPSSVIKAMGGGGGGRYM